MTLDELYRACLEVRLGESKDFDTEELPSRRALDSIQTRLQEIGVFSLVIVDGKIRARCWKLNRGNPA